MSAKHTPGPWVIQDDTDIVDSAGAFVATAHLPESAVGTATEYANAARIVDCVNACEGMDDPAAEIARLRDDLREALDALEAMTVYDAGAVVHSHAEAILRKHGRAV